ncbi:SDR family oxidoreductase [Alphaproteobacteria bacterium]|nr:SDR family oxidoreductase [Alphaproteobacteria bacterium]MDC0131388.1 SDR family oxidoreductase [Alphaproteobacteria bacterium]MDC0148598.1 SDR family oxidoreductase [Alphaproteobacteria bacterium]
MANGDGMKHMMFFGFGFCAAALAPSLKAQGWRLSATCRTPEKAAQLAAQNIEALIWPDEAAAFSVADLDGVTHGLISAPPEAAGDPVLAKAGAALAARASALQWLGYLSTTGVYGDHGGAWIDEDTPPGRVGERGQKRVDAEAQWAQFGAQYELPIMYFRLAGIYGPGRNQLTSVANHTARRIDKPGQVFSRIHVQDIATILAASIDQPNPGRAYNLCDDEPAPPQDVVAFAAELLGHEPPPLLPFETVSLSPMARSFYGDNKRTSNQRVKDELGVSLRYPNYRDGLTALFNSKDY